MSDLSVVIGVISALASQGPESKTVQVTEAILSELSKDGVPYTGDLLFAEKVIVWLKNHPGSSIPGADTYYHNHNIKEYHG